MKPITNEVYIETRYPGELGLLPDGKLALVTTKTFLKFVEQIYNNTNNFLTSNK